MIDWFTAAVGAVTAGIGFWLGRRVPRHSYRWYCTRRECKFHVKATDPHEIERAMLIHRDQHERSNT